MFSLSATRMRSCRALSLAVGDKVEVCVLLSFSGILLFGKMSVRKLMTKCLLSVRFSVVWLPFMRHLPVWQLKITCKASNSRMPTKTGTPGDGKENTLKDMPVLLQDSFTRNNA